MFRAAVLAAGLGSRLRASGVAAPKALAAVDGVPLILRVCRQLREAGARQLDAIVNPEAREAAALLGADGIDARILFATTPSSFRSLCALLPQLGGDPFLLSLVDSVFESAELAAFVERARAQPDDVWLGVTDYVADESPLRVALEDDDRVTAIGTPAAEGSPYVTGGVYWLPRSVASLAAEAEGCGISRLRHFLAFLLESGARVRAHRFSRIVDVDTGDDLRQAQGLGARAS